MTSAAAAGPEPALSGLRRAPTSAIRASDSASCAAAEIRLGLGAPTWFAGEVGLPTAARRALAEVRSAPYGPHVGEIELRRAIADYEDVSVDEVLVTSGAQGALFALASACLGPGDVALVPDPGFPAYATLARMAGAEARTYELSDEDFELDPELVRAALEREPRARLLVINHPGNPTGGGASRDALAAVAEECERRGVLLVSDEVYRELHLSSRPTSLRDVSRYGVVVSSVSKGWGAPGLRVGWVIGDPEILECCRGWHAWAVTSAAIPSQSAAAALLRARMEILPMARLHLARRFAAADEAWGAELGESLPRPAGGLYCWLRVPGDDFCAALAAAESVSIVPGVAFGSRGVGWARLSLGAELHDVTEGARRVARFLAQRRSLLVAS